MVASHEMIAARDCVAKANGNSSMSIYFVATK